MSRTAAVALMAVAVIGCGDAETDPLPAKSSAEMADPQGLPVNIYPYTQAGSEEEPTPHGFPVPSGTVVQVLEDDASLSATSADRMVEVRVTEGEWRKLVGFVARSKLRPIRIK